MIDEEVAIAVSAVLIIAGIIVVTQAVLPERVREPFSELGLLGPEKKLAGYPKEIAVGEKVKLFIYVGNREGKTMLYQIRVKIGTREDFINETLPLDRPVIAVYERVLMNNQTWIHPVELAFDEEGTNLRLVFEMWVYDENANTFKYNGRWNQLWLNITSPAV